MGLIRFPVHFVSAQFGIMFTHLSNLILISMFIKVILINMLPCV